jgi:amino acid adenylation domain-containing protein
MTTASRIARLPALDITSAGRPSQVPLSWAQRGLWLMSRMHPDSCLYNVDLALWLDGPLDTVALGSALEQVAARHEILRTTFPATGGEPWQRVEPDARPLLEHTDLGAVAPGARAHQAAEQMALWVRQPFDLAAGPLVRAHLIRLGPTRHLFGLSLHHIVCDGLSVHIFFAELAEFYGGASTLPALPAQFADYAIWQSKQGVDPDQRAWWREYLAGVPTVLHLPTDRPRPAVRGTRGSTHVFGVPAPVMDGVRALARQLRATPYIVLLTAYAGLLGRLTGSRDLLIGTPVSDRSLPETESLIGYFLDVLPVRIDLSADPTFAAAVDRVRTSVFGVLSHQQVPFESLVEELRPARDPSHTPLVQAIFTADLAPAAAPVLAGLHATPMKLLPEVAKFDLDLDLRPPSAGDRDFQGTISYDAGLFDATTIERFCDRFRRLLSAAVESPHTPLWRLPVMADDERSVILHQWSRSGAARPARPFVHETLALAPPAAPALIAGGQTMSYGTLTRRARGLAAHLRRAGVGPGDVVGIGLPRGAEAIIALLGVLTAGAGYLPLDPAQPAVRLARLLSSAGTRYVITDASWSHRIGGAGLTKLLLEHIDQDTAPVPVPVPVHVHPDDLAYAIFTSGSTGEPKAVAIPHRALSNHARAIRDAYALRPADRVLQFASLSFDVAAEELFPTWAGGGSVVLCPDPPPPPGALNSLLTAEAVTVVNLPAGYWERWTAELGASGIPPARSLRLVVIGSESVSPAALATWDELTAVPVINAYGLTETTISSVIHFVAEPDATAGNVPIGRPIAGVETFVLGTDLDPVPAGFPGELYVGGACLARGYLGRPELTAQRFVPHPFGAPGTRLHRSGDLVRQRRDGTLEFLGRLDDQIKIRGYRIEPGEIEATLCEHPDVTQAVVVARADVSGEQVLVGYAVPRPDATLPPDLREYVAERLPAYLVPGIFFGLPALPLRANGKVDRAALPAPTRPVRVATVPPRTELERALARIWQDVLHVGEVGVQDNFFDLGGNSVLLSAVHAAVVEVLARRVPMVTLYEFPTIAALGRHLSGSQGPPAERAPDPRLRGRDRLARRRRLTDP